MAGFFRGAKSFRAFSRQASYMERGKCKLNTKKMSIHIKENSLREKRVGKG